MSAILPSSVPDHASTMHDNTCLHVLIHVIYNMYCLTQLRYVDWFLQIGITPDAVWISSLRMTCHTAAPYAVLAFLPVLDGKNRLRVPRDDRHRGGLRRPERRRDSLSDCVSVLSV